MGAPTEPPQVETFLQKRLRLKAEREATSNTPRAAAPVVVDSDNLRARRWVARKLEENARQVSGLTEGERNHGLNAAAYSLGRLVPKWLDEQTVIDRLYEAAIASGLGGREAALTIRSGLNGGQLDPRDPPIDPDDPSGLASLVAGGATTTPARNAAPAPTRTPDDAASQEEEPQDPLGSWNPVDLTSYLDGTYTPPQPCHLERTDTTRLIYPARVHWLSGEPEALKSWLGMLTCSQALLRGEQVIYLDLEDGAAGVTSRLLSMGVPLELLRDQFTYLAPHEPLTHTKKLHLEPLLQGASLLVIDACTESLALQQLSPKDDVDIASWLALLPRWAARQGLTVLVLDHVVKDTETRGRWATGSQHKLAGLDGVAFTLEAITPGGRGMRGRSRLYVSKDRHGEVRPHTQRVKGGKDWVGDLIVDSTTGCYTEVVLEPPSNAHTSTDIAPTDLMEQISRVMQKLDRPLSGREITDRIKGRGAEVRAALAALVDDGYVSISKGEKNANLHTLEQPYPPVEEAV